MMAAARAPRIAAREAARPIGEASRNHRGITAILVALDDDMAGQRVKRRFVVAVPPRRDALAALAGHRRLRA
jgi:hypothetical protein